MISGIGCRNCNQDGSPHCPPRAPGTRANLNERDLDMDRHNKISLSVEAIQQLANYMFPLEGEKN